MKVLGRIAFMTATVMVPLFFLLLSYYQQQINIVFYIYIGKEWICIGPYAGDHYEGQFKDGKKDGTGN